MLCVVKVRTHRGGDIRAMWRSQRARTCETASPEMTSDAVAACIWPHTKQWLTRRLLAGPIVYLPHIHLITLAARSYTHDSLCDTIYTVPVVAYIATLPADFSRTHSSGSGAVAGYCCRLSSGKECCCRPCGRETNKHETTGLTSGVGVQRGTVLVLFGLGERLYPLLPGRFPHITQNRLPTGTRGINDFKAYALCRRQSSHSTVAFT